MLGDLDYLTRSFEMTRENMIDLAILSDKYIIEFLRRDIEVWGIRMPRPY